MHTWSPRLTRRDIEEALKGEVTFPGIASIAVMMCGSEFGFATEDRLAVGKAIGSSIQTTDEITAAAAHLSSPEHPTHKGEVLNGVALAALTKEDFQTFAGVLAIAKILRHKGEGSEEVNLKLVPLAVSVTTTCEEYVLMLDALKGHARYLFESAFKVKAYFA